VKRTPLKRISRKQAAIKRSLAKLVKAYLESHPRCEFMMTDNDCAVWGEGPDGNLYQCPRPSTNVHHIRGRSAKYTLDVTTFMANCNYHHPNYIHFVAPKEAREKGYIKT
jgi:hypothetical protein